jgi:hypothetical protein
MDRGRVEASWENRMISRRALHVIDWCEWWVVRLIGVGLAILAILAIVDAVRRAA